jgi:hypothetical protein
VTKSGVEEPLENLADYRERARQTANDPDPIVGCRAFLRGRPEAMRREALRVAAAAAAREMAEAAADAAHKKRLKELDRQYDEIMAEIATRQQRFADLNVDGPVGDGASPEPAAEAGAEGSPAEPKPEGIPMPSFAHAWGGDDDTEEIKKTSGQNWAGVLLIMLLLTAICTVDKELAPEEQERVRQQLTADYTETLARKQKFAAFTGKVLKRFPVLVPFKESVTKTSTLCGVEAANLGSQAKRDSKRERDEDLDICDRLKTAWNWNLLGPMWTGLMTLSMRDWCLDKNDVGLAVEWVAGLVGTIAVEPEQRAAIRTVHVLQQLGRNSAVAMWCLHLNDWEIAPAAQMMTTTAAQFEAQLFEGFWHFAKDTIARDAISWEFVRAVAREAFGNSPPGCSALAKQLLQTWQRDIAARDTYNAWLKVVAEGFTIDTVLFMGCTPMVEWRIAQDKFDTLCWTTPRSKPPCVNYWRTRRRTRT